MTPVISDGNTQGTRGMRYSLVSRDWIADCVEIMHEGYMADACISFGACDKTVPGAVMPLARTNTSSCFVYGGPLGTNLHDLQRILKNHSLPLPGSWMTFFAFPPELMLI
jgi:dihydroxy-acid dehydratase